LDWPNVVTGKHRNFFTQRLIFRLEARHLFPNAVTSSSTLLLRWSFLSPILFERKTRKTSLQGVDRLVIAGRKHQAPTVFVKDYGRAFC
jgi:hypothetical protein